MLLDSSQHASHEKAAARELRKSRWWQSRIAQAICYYCAAPVAPAEATMDHVVPIALGGRTTKGNVVVACKPCNSAKRDRSAVEWSLERPNPPLD